MSWKHVAGIGPALAWAPAALVLAADLSGAQADAAERVAAASEVLEQRLDTLVLAAPIGVTGAGAPVAAGGFPRSFLIPGTDVSLRVGGQVIGSVLWY